MSIPSRHGVAIKVAALGTAALAASLALAQAPAAPAAPAAAPAAPPPQPQIQQAPGANPQANALYVRSLAATCANCHGPEGRAVEGAALVSLAGQPRDYIIAQMQAFKRDQRTGMASTIMHQLAKGYSDQQIELIATYFSQQKK
jgi:cytochrome c553